jgi:dTDP-L-rhamnose 4-epimerase
MKVLITGGAGFIGQNLARSLVEHGVSVVILDNFLAQVHGITRQLPNDLAEHVKLVIGDVADPEALSRALEGVERIVHLAAETGTGQSMYEVSRYSRTNLHGAAVLFDLITNQNRNRIDRIVVASSRAVYGEGAYLCHKDGLVYPNSRTSAEKQARLFDPVCPVCGENCIPAPTPEDAPERPSSFYGLTKLSQEKMTLLFGQALGIPSVALRYQNVFGPGQSLQNPYTGILAIFSNLARAGKDIKIFEDGNESRDFVYIEDVVAVTRKAVLGPLQGCHSINVGSGNRISVLEVANLINTHFGGKSAVRVEWIFREGDIRHGFADLERARQVLDYKPAWSFGAGLERFLSWVAASAPLTEGYERSLSEMRERGLLRA